MNNINNQYMSFDEDVAISIARPIYNNPDIIPRSALRNIQQEQNQQEQLILTTKRCIQNSINIFIFLLIFTFIITDLIIIIQLDTVVCIKKYINLNNINNSIHILFSLEDYFIVDIVLTTFILIILLYFINIQFQHHFSLRLYKCVLYISIPVAVFQIIWLILSILTIIDKELINVCSTSIYAFTYSNIVTRFILLFTLSSIIISTCNIL